MFPCIGCAKQTSDDDRDERDEGSRRQSGTPLQRQDSGKSITSQFKDMVMKFSGSSKQSTRSGLGSGSGGYAENTVVGGVQYPYNYMGGDDPAAARAWLLKTSLQIVSGRTEHAIILGPAGQVPPRGQSGVAAPNAAVKEEDDGGKWEAQADPGVIINFDTLPEGGNQLKNIYFSPEIFTRLDASQWWHENYDTVIDFYDVKKINDIVVPPKVEDQQAAGDISFPIQSSGTDSPVAEWLNNNVAPSEGIQSSASAITFEQGMQPMNQHPSSGAAASSTMATVLEAECRVQDQEGVFITIRANPDGTKEIRRVKFNSEMFREEDAKKWWEENKERIQAQYL